MSTTTKNICFPAKVIGLESKKDAGNLVAVCSKMKKQPKSAPPAARGLERRATTDPTCCPRYPPGTTLLECRFEGDEPVAHVVQVACNGKTASQKTCLLVETKQSSSGPYSRVISRPIEYPEEPNQCNGSPQPRTAFRLESRECHKGPLATITKVPVADCTGDFKEIMTFETSKGECQADGPASRILYGPTTGGSNCAESPRNLPTSIIECRSTAKKTLARISRCPDVSSHKPGDSTSGLHDTVETRIDTNGPKAYAINFSEDMEGSSAKEEVELTSNGQCPNNYQQPKRKRSETLKCSTIRPASTKLEPPTKRRNGLDSVDNLPVSLFNRMPRSGDCPHHKSGSSSVERGERDASESSKLFKCVLVPSSVTEKLLRETEKLSEDRTRPKVPSRMKIRDVEARKLSEDCARPKTSSRVEVGRNGSRNEAKTNSGRERSAAGCSKDFVPEIRSQELLTRFRDYFPPHQLQRYEVCRSKRNGLQDQCQLPIPRAVIELKRKEMLSRDSKPNSDSPELTQPMILVCSDHKSIANCDNSLKEYVESVCG
uniref:uncharacterized protein LOC117605126 n=1 Tax=Osmia lignaria TaxID=473952 RepID=UPI001478B5D9|nr:uncharacterized protein LOC117605126 [Osmia lignaria]